MAIEDIRRYGSVLEELLASKGVSKRSVENKLGLARGTITKLCQGKYELKVSSLLGILEAIDVEPLFFYHLVHRPGEAPERPSIVSKILTSFGSPEEEVEPLTLPRNLTAEELEAMIEGVVRRILAERA